MSKVVFVLGPPGCGKGTQCALLSERLGVPHISTGDALRDEISAGTELGMKIAHAFHQGELMESADVLQVVRSRLQKPDCKNGVLLDGAARKIEEAQNYLDSGLLTDLIWMNMPDRVCKSRVANRVVDPETKLAYNLESNPPPLDIADRCVRRKMDADIDGRLEIFHKTTKPVFLLVEDHPEARLHTLMLEDENIEDVYVRMKRLLKRDVNFGPAQ